MRIRAVTIAACCSAVLFIAQVAQGQPPQNLADVKTILVDSVGQGEFSNTLRERIINGLSTSGRFQFTLDPQAADATLKVSVSGEQAVHHGTGVKGRFDGTLQVQMVGKDQRVLWTSAANGQFFSRTAPAIAANVIKELMKAAGANKAKAK